MISYKRDSPLELLLEDHNYLDPKMIIYLLMNSNPKTMEAGDSFFLIFHVFLWTIT
jgi:hypothetical protein